MKKEILLVAPYTSFAIDGLPNRFAAVAEELTRRGHSVELVTSDFIHRLKRKRNYSELDTENFKVTLIQTLRYKRNFGIGRFLNIFFFSKNFGRKFPEFSKYDVVYASYPMIGPCHHIAKTNRKAKFFVDIQDLWPEAIWHNFSVFSVMKFIFAPFQKKKGYIFSKADSVISVSQTYLEAYSDVILTPEKHVCYLGSDLSIEKTKKKKFPIKLFYFGTLSFSYDIKTVCAAVTQLRKRGLDFEFHVFGDGPEKGAIAEAGYEGTFLYGFVPYKELREHISEMDASVNSIKAGAAQSITNKLSDYLFIGSPMINSQTSPEIDGLLESKNVIQYTPGDADDLVRELSSRSNLEIIAAPWVPDIRFDRESQIMKICDLVED